MALIGYARVSTLEQTLDPQLRELRAAGCAIIHEEQASGADRTRRALSRLLATIKPGDTLVWSGWTGWPARLPTFCRASIS